MNRKLIGLAILAAVILLLALWGPAACQKMRSQQAQSKLDRAQSDAFQNSAGDAVNTQSAVNQREREAEDLTRANDKEIRNAEGAGDRVNPGVRDAGLQSLCRRKAYRDSERCRVLRAPPARVEARR